MMDWIRRNWLLLPVILLAVVMLLKGLVRLLPEFSMPTDVSVPDTSNFSNDFVTWFIVAVLLAAITLGLKFTWCRPYIMVALVGVVSYALLFTNLPMMLSEWDWATTPFGKLMEERVGSGTAIWLWLPVVLLVLWALRKVFQSSSASTVGRARSISDKFDDWNFSFFVIGFVVFFLFIALAIMEATGVLERGQRILAGHTPIPISLECKAPEDLDLTERRIDFAGKCIRVSRFDKPFAVTIIDGYYADDGRWMQSGQWLELSFNESMRTTHPGMYANRTAGEFLTLSIQNGLAHWYTPNHDKLADAGVAWVDVYLKARRPPP